MPSYSIPRSQVLGEKSKQMSSNCGCFYCMMPQSNNPACSSVNQNWSRNIISRYCELKQTHLRKNFIKILPPCFGETLNNQTLFPRAFVIFWRVPSQAVSVELDNDALRCCYGNMKVSVVVVVAEE